MIDHVALQCADPLWTLEFYVDVFAPVGVVEVMRYDGLDGPVIGLGSTGFPSLWIASATDHGFRPLHLALTAGSTDAVRDVHNRAVAWGAEVLHPPRHWPEYHAAYFAVFLRDPDDNNVEAVCHQA